jgi:hypothetical protein
MAHILIRRSMGSVTISSLTILVLRGFPHSGHTTLRSSACQMWSSLAVQTSKYCVLEGSVLASRVNMYIVVGTASVCGNKCPNVKRNNFNMCIAPFCLTHPSVMAARTSRENCSNISSKGGRCASSSDMFSLSTSLRSLPLSPLLPLPLLSSSLSALYALCVISW